MRNRRTKNLVLRQQEGNKSVLVGEVVDQVHTLRSFRVAFRLHVFRVLADRARFSAIARRTRAA
jgi:hypothetical protein